MALGLLFSPFPCHSGIRCKHHSGRNPSFRLYKNADIVITGEGCLDGQTVMGKAPAGVAKIAKEFQKPVLAFSGCVTEDAKACHAAGIDAFFPIVRGAVSLKDAMQTDHAKQNMTDTVEQVFRMLRTFQNTK